MNTTTTTPPAPTWRGWVRCEGGRWEAVCTGPTYDLCWLCLVAVRRPCHAEKLVSQGDPNEILKRPRRRF